MNTQRQNYMKGQGLQQAVGTISFQHLELENSKKVQTTDLSQSYTAFEELKYVQDEIDSSNLEIEAGSSVLEPKSSPSAMEAEASSLIKEPETHSPVLEAEAGSQMVAAEAHSSTVADDSGSSLPEDYIVENLNSDNRVNQERQPSVKKYKHQKCQVNFLIKSHDDSKTFTSARYISNGVSDAEVQTDINILVSSKKTCDKSCSTEKYVFKEKAVGTDENSFLVGFRGYEQIKDDDQCSDLLGVSKKVFEFLLKRSPNVVGEKFKINNENRLLIFLMMFKTGLGFSALGVLFNVSRTTISRIFYVYLDHLSQSLSNLIVWPNKDVVQGSMPECFKKNFSDTRVVIDCTEFKMEIPAGVDNRVFCYSMYKKGFTGKLLIGMLPCGYICFRTKLAGGRKSDSQITVESGLLGLLEDGDLVLADKGFPEVSVKLQENGQKAFIVMPPFLEKKQAFTQEETQKTYNVASVRIHVERIMQRLRIYNILNKVPHHLFGHMDDVITVCCALVNLQPPIITPVNDNDEQNG